MTDIAKLWSQHLPTEKYLIVKTQIEELSHFSCFAATNHKTGKHSYIMELNKEVEVPDYKTLNFQGVRVQLFELEEVNELHVFLMDSDLKGIFSKFINNIIEDISIVPTQKEALLVTFNVIQKWKKLFDKLTSEGLSLEQQKGLIGELLVIKEFCDSKHNVESIILGWLGPEGHDKDFLISDKAIEAKFTTSKLPRIRITSEHQLDFSNLSNLFLSQFQAEKAKEGISLNLLVDFLRESLSNTISLLDVFNQKLVQAGYLEKHTSNYETLYSIKKWNLYHVQGDFPKIQQQDLPKGIYNTSYFIERSAINDYEIDIDKLQDILKNG